MGVSSVTEAAVSMNAVDFKSGGLAQPEWYVIEFANIVLVTTSVLLNSAGAPCQVGGVGRPAVCQPALKVQPPIVLFRRPLDGLFCERCKCHSCVPSLL